jgi:hypothetical protein
VIDRDPKRNPGKRTGVRWISARYSFRENLQAIGFTVAQNHGQILRTKLIRQALDDSLILEVHRACGGSNKTFGGLKDNLETRALQALGNNRSRNAVAFANGDHSFTF